LGVEDEGLEEDEGSLADFEEEFLKEKKKKSSRILFFVLLLLILLGAGYYFAAKKGLLPESLSGLIGGESAEEESADTKQSEEFQEDEIQIEDKGAGEEDEKPILEKIEPKVAGTKKREKPSKKDPKSYGSGQYTFHIGVYSHEKNAETMVARLEKAGLKPEISKVKIRAERVRVLVGHYPFREIAIKEADDLLQRGFKPKVQIVKAGEYALVMGIFPKRQAASELINSLEDKGLEVWTDKVMSDSDRISATLVKIKGVRGPMVEKVVDFLDRKKIDYVLKR
jgi:cell division septation protein DedD